MEWWQTLIIGLTGLGVVGDILAHAFLPYRREEDRAKAAKAKADTITVLHSIIKTQAETIEKLNNTIDDKTEQIRKGNNNLMASELEKSKLNAMLLKLTEENGHLKVLAEHYKMWMCKRNDCQDPRGGRPPRKHLEGVNYEPPE